jgi:hypothetical protein
MLCLGLGMLEYRHGMCGTDYERMMDEAELEYRRQRSTQEREQELKYQQWEQERAREQDPRYEWMR